MATGDVELKFRMTDGSDIGPNKYSSSETVQALKEAIIEKWPQGACQLYVSLTRLNA